MSLPIGVLFSTDRMTGHDVIDAARQAEEIGVESIWLAELFGREPFATAGLILASTSRLVVGTAIGNVYVRDATATAAAAQTLAEASGGRFILGLGVSNRGLIGARGHTWEPPAPKLAGYLEAVRSQRLTLPDADYPIHVAAHGPRMLEVASAGADGVFTYLMSPEHTARTRQGLTPDHSLTPMTMVLACEEPDRARDLARRALDYYIPLDYYHRAWRKLGFEDSDFVDGGSDRLIDTIVAWGSVTQIRERLAAHEAAGATRAIVIPLGLEGGRRLDWDLLGALTD
ncbi:MAG: TIGR03620 family F420-dependent LLM class oxidoreductase [Actinomycetota bacterium]